MKLYFLTPKDCDLAAKDTVILNGIRNDLLGRHGHTEAPSPAAADAIVINEENSFKEWRYVSKLLKDPVIGRYPHKVYTINTDDWATGLLRGIYTSLPGTRFNPQFHGLVPFAAFPNQAVLERRMKPRPEPQYLATWRGNGNFNRKLRNFVFNVCRKSPKFLVEKAESGLNQDENEKNHNVDVILAGRFFALPGGLGACDLSHV